jgi:hypothetical protein
VASPDKKAFLLRLPPDLWAQLERLAAAELRSVNGQIEYLLREALARRTGSNASASNNTRADGAPHQPDTKEGASKRTRKARE